MLDFHFLFLILILIFFLNFDELPEKKKVEKKKNSP